MNNPKISIIYKLKVAGRKHTAGAKERLKQIGKLMPVDIVMEGTVSSISFKKQSFK